MSYIKSALNFRKSRRRFFLSSRSCTQLARTSLNTWWTDGTPGSAQTRRWSARGMAGAKTGGQWATFGSGSSTSLPGPGTIRDWLCPSSNHRTWQSSKKCGFHRASLSRTLSSSATISALESAEKVGNLYGCIVYTYLKFNCFSEFVHQESVYQCQECVWSTNPAQTT